MTIAIAGTGLAEALQSITGSYDMVLGENGTYVVGLPDIFQSLHEIVPSLAYYLRVTKNQAVTLTQVAPPFNPSAPITLTIGWHWIGFCDGQSSPITIALQSIAGQYDMVLGEESAYVVGLPDMFQSLHELRQGKGYQIRMTADGSLVYPEGSAQMAAVSTTTTRQTPSKACANVQNTPYRTLAYGNVQVAGQPAPVGTVIQAVTPRGVIAGCGVVMTPGHFGVMHLYGEDADASTPGFRTGDMVTWQVSGQDASGTPVFTWADDKDPHQLRLEVTSSARTIMPTYLPLVAN